MLGVLALAAVLWGLGWALGWPARGRLALICGLWLAVIGLHLWLPVTHPLRLAIGGDARIWLVLGGIFALVLGYARLLAGLKARAGLKVRARLGGPAPVEPVTEPAPPANPAPLVAGSTPGPASLQPAELDRYSRHILLHEIGGPGQRALKSARVLVVGAGGLGAPVLMYLAAAGIGRITVIDKDRVEASNLQRQIIHAEVRIGMNKAESAALALRALNPQIEVEAIAAALDRKNGAALIAAHDLVLDGSDDLATRELVNQLAVQAQVPLVWGALARWEGQVSLFDPCRGGPCLACLFPVRPDPGMVPSCAEAGVAGPLPGLIGAIMALEAVKYLTGAGECLRGALAIHDALYADARRISMRPRPGCPVCGHLHAG